jgi:cytochrome c-type biogenesis protein
MIEWIIALTSALWLGILTSISPCPLATNIAAVSFIGKQVQKPRRILYTGLLYTAGRMLTYIVLGVALVYSLLSAPMVSHHLQKYMNMFLGPLLMLVGMLLLNLIAIPIVSKGWLEGLQQKATAMGMSGAFLLGVLFALSFCPTSAALFFGSLIPLALKYESAWSMPAVYGFATGIPVVAFSIVLGMGGHKIGKAYNSVVAFEKWARYITGVIFILVGIYYTLISVWGISLT